MLLTTIFILLAMHCIGDYPMQGEFLANYKSKNNVVLLTHCIIYTAFITLGVFINSIILNIPLSINTINLVIGITFISHFFIDKWKCMYRKVLYDRTDISDEERNKRDVQSFHTDQALHMIVLALLYVLI